MEFGQKRMESNGNVAITIENDIWTATISVDLF